MNWKWESRKRRGNLSQIHPEYFLSWLGTCRSRASQKDFGALSMVRCRGQKRTEPQFLNARAPICTSVGASDVWPLTPTITEGLPLSPKVIFPCHPKVSLRQTPMQDRGVTGHLAITSEGSDARLPHHFHACWPGLCSRDFRVPYSHHKVFSHMVVHPNLSKPTQDPE